MMCEIHKTILQNAPFAYALHQIVETDNSISVDYRFIEVNKSFEKVTGLGADELLGKTIDEVFPVTNQRLFDWFDIYGQVARSGNPVAFEQYIEPLQRWCRIEAFAPEAGQFACFLIDIDNSKSKETLVHQPLQSKEAGDDTMRKLIEAMPDMLFVMHRDGTVIEIHGAIPEQLIAPHEQLIGASIKNCFEPEEFDRHIKIYQHCIETNETGHIDFELSIGDKKMYFESRVQPLDHEKLLTIVRDKSDQKNLLERISDGFVAFDRDLNYTFVNKAAGIYLGKNPIELVGKNISKEFYESKSSSFTQACHKAIENQQSTCVEEYYEPWKRWFSNTIYPSPNGISVIFQEITEQKMAELAIKESLDNFYNFFNSSIDILWVLDFEANILQMNATARHRLGYNEEELIGKSVLQVHPESLRGQVKEIVAEMLQGKRQNCPIPLQTKNGIEIPVETYVFEGRWDGKPALFGVSRDISALKLSEEKFAKAFHSSPNLIGLSDLKTGEYVEVNQAFYDIMEYAPEELKGKKVKDLVRMEPSFRKKALEMLKEQGSVRNLETTLFSKSGKPVHVLLSADVIRINETDYNFTTGVDISERKNAELALAESEKRYAFLAGTASELAGIGNVNDIYTYTANKLSQLLNGHTILAIVEFNQHANTWKMKHLEGVGKWINDLSKLLGFDLSNIEGELSTKYLDKITSGRLVEIDFDFPGLFNNKVSDLAGNAVKKMLSLDNMYCITFKQNNQLLGNITFTTNKKTGTVNVGLIEAFVSQVSNFLNRLMAEEEQRKSESRYRVYVDNAPLGVFIVDQHGKYLEVNDEACRLTGYPAEELLKKKFIEIIDPDSIESARAHFVKLIDEGRTSGEFAFRTKTGEKQWWNIVGAKLSDERFLGFAENITARRQAEEALHESEEKHRQLLQHLHAGVVVHASDTSIRYANDQASELLGQSIEQMMGKTAIDPDWHFLQEDLTPMPISQYPVQYVIANKAPLREQILGIHRPEKNDLVWVLINAFPEFEPDGAIQQVVVTFIDITRRKQAEEALRLANDIVSNVQLGMYVYHLEDIDDDRTLRMISANPATEAMTGVKVSDVIGKTLDENFPYLRDKGFPQGFAEVVRHGEARIFEDTFYSDNRVIQACFSVKAFPLPHNHLGVAFENITEKVQAQNEIAESNSRLKMAQEIGNVGSWEFDLITNKVTWSEQTYHIYEQDPDTFETTFDNIVSHYPPQDNQAVIAALNKTISEQVNLEIEHKIITGKGNTRFVLESGRLILSENGEPLKLIGSVADITEHKTIENALRESRNLFQQISLISKTGGWNVDLVTGENKWTDVTREIHEVGPDFVPNMEMAINFYEEQESREKITKVVNRCIETGESFDTEVQIITAKGNKRWVRSIGSAVFQDGKCIQLHGTIQDITERKKAEEALRESEEQLKAIFDNSLNSIMIADDSGNYLKVNPAAAKMFQYPIEQLQQMKVGDLNTSMAPDAAARYQEYVRKGFEIGEFDIIYPDKSRGIAQYHAVRVRENFNLSILSDITERKRAEEALRQREALLNKIFDVLPVGLWLADKTGKLIRSNEKGREIWGAEPLVGIDQYDVFKARFLPSGKELAAQDWALARTMLTGVTVMDEMLEIDTFDGKKKVILNYTTPIFDENGNFDGAVIVNLDITKRKQTEDALSIAKEKAEESDRLKTAFLNNISHEIRTPLNGIIGFGDLMLDEGLSRQQKMDYHLILLESSDRLQQTVDDIIDISEINAGSIDPQITNVPIAIKMAGYAQQLEMACAAKNIITDFQIPEDIESFVLPTDEDLFDKILRHLLGNAKKFTTSGRITYGFELKDNAVQFFVKDTGKGIAPEMLELVFEPFMQEDVSNTRGYEGSGLGLSIARGMVELLGGRLWVESEKGVGSTFFFTLPLHEPIRKLKPETPVVEKSKSASNPVILIAEDDENSAELMQVLMRKAGYTTLYAADGEKAVNLCREYPEIALIVMDIRLPVLNGLEATKQIKQFRPRLPVIALTAQAQQSDKVTILEAGCDKFIAKPFRSDMLIGLIKRMLA